MRELKLSLVGMQGFPDAKSRSLLASSTCLQPISRAFGIENIMVSISLSLLARRHCSIKSTSDNEQLKQTNWILEEEDAQKIRMTILKVRNGTVNDVIMALESMEQCCQMQITTDLVDTLLQKFGDDWKSALGLFHWVGSRPGYKHTSYAYNRMVDLLGKMKQTTRMWELIEMMRRGGFMTVETVAKVMRRLAGAGKWRDAVSFFDDLEKMGLEKDTGSMNLLLDTLCKEGKVQVAREVFLELKSYIPADAYTFNIFVHGWCNACKIEEAVWTVQEMRGSGFHPSVITYSTILKAYCKKSNFPKAYELLDEMTAEGSPPNVVSYTILINSLARSQNIEELLNVVNRMESYGCKPDTRFYNTLINILGKAGRLNDASHIFDVEMRMNGVYPDLSTYNIMISLFCYHNREQDAMCILKDMENSTCKPVIQTYFPLLKLCFRTGKLDDQLKSLLSDITMKHHLSLDLDTYTLLVHGLCNSGKAEWAFLLFDEMISLEIIPKIRTLWLLMDLAERKNMSIAVEKIKILMSGSKL
ncbi:Pentatricopeptide repeat-containing protein [Apostasia shenzhenica]|uniref:Pentatricopeptide repeat-containing protein n=1 Tax=Apostasia shenzhenica TaxID=1088818 RepID=A0A2I0AQI7_9ASPA|nr:Pentatricopeptide repeat-containing protein [Apostasia shenzhenica]